MKKKISEVNQDVIGKSATTSRAEDLRMAPEGAGATSAGGR